MKAIDTLNRLEASEEFSVHDYMNCTFIEVEWLNWNIDVVPTADWSLQNISIRQKKNQCYARLTK